MNVICCIGRSLSLCSCILNVSVICILWNWFILQNLTFPEIELHLVTVTTKFLRSGWFLHSFQGTLTPKHGSWFLKWWSYSETAATVHVTSSSAWLNSCFIIRNEKGINKILSGPLCSTLVTLSGRGNLCSKSWKLQVNHSSVLVLVSFSKNPGLLHP